MNTIKYTRMESPVGPLLLAADESGLREIRFVNGRESAVADPDWIEDSAALADVTRELSDYFAGRLQQFSIKLSPKGTPFQQLVWRKLLDIPYGTTISYGELARRVGNPNASRAVGLANGQNPLPIVVPCHRVIGANGKLTGYGGGLPIKEHLLGLERGGKLSFGAPPAG